MLPGASGTQAELTSTEKKILVAYFSHSGNTREIARQIHERVGGDLFEVATVDAYPADYEAVVAQARREQSAGHRPTLRTGVKEIGRYDIVFVGYPNWCGTVPAPIVAFLTDHDLSGKTVIPFCTHEGSGLGRSEKDIARLCPRSAFLRGLAARGSNVKRAQSEVSAWLRGLKLTQQEGSH